MRTETINFPDQATLSVFPDERSNLAEAIAELGLNGGHPVITPLTQPKHLLPTGRT